MAEQESGKRKAIIRKNKRPTHKEMTMGSSVDEEGAVSLKSSVTRYTSLGMGKGETKNGWQI